MVPTSPRLGRRAGPVGEGPGEFIQTVMREPPPSVGVHPALRLVRVGNLGVSFAGTIVGGLVARGAGIWISPGVWVAVLLAALSTSLVTAGGNVLNDLLDREGDRTNHPDRPLVTGAISVKMARALAVALFVLGVAVVVPVILIEPLVGLLLALAVGALLGYEFRLKSRGFVGNLVVGFLTGMVFLYGGAAAGNALLLAPFAAMAFLATLSREVVKDMEDVAGTSVGRPCRRPGEWGFPAVPPGSRSGLPSSSALPHSSGSFGGGLSWGLSTSSWSSPQTRCSSSRWRTSRDGSTGSRR